MLADKQAITTAQPHHLLSSSQGRGSLHQPRGAQTKAAAATPLNVLPSPYANVMDKLYGQLVEIHAITAAQLVEVHRGALRSKDGSTATD
jgi:hypothetical protein